MLLLLFVSTLDLLPFTTNEIASPVGATGPAGWFLNYPLLWVALAVLFSAQYIRFTRSNMLETFGEDFMRTARSKGLSRRRIVTACRAAGSRAITPMPPPRHWPRRPGEPIEMSLAVATVGGASMMNHDVARLTGVADRPGPA
ncbi:ABC transporter permease subunit, partial [Streptomyces sp. NPDC057543]|uniref:ABC transporter permease subunit n=1 Tax=Streptomyces sp. NPDC057543 TaxID=3346163 RepID=UPI0036966AD3